MREFFKVVTLGEACARSADFAPVGTETVPAPAALGRVLARDFFAPEDLPGFPRSTMDGYAVCASSTFGASDSSPALLALVGRVAMGRAPDCRVGPGEAAAILTGGMIPPGADAVVMVEHTEVIDETTIEVTRAVAPRQNVIDPADDAARGDRMIEAGRRLRAPELGLFASFGTGEVEVFARPAVGILSTGDEVVPPEATPGPGRVRDVNSVTLSALVDRTGAVPRSYGIVGDRFEDLRAACESALGECDAVLVSGGSSVGTRDLTLKVLESLPGCRVLFHGVALRPGKPTILADAGGRALWGLPGHVASAMVVYHALVRGQIERLAGLRPRPIHRVPARITRNVSSAQGRTEFLRVRLEEGEGGLRAVPILGKSGLLRTMVTADGLVRIDRDAEGLEEGAEVQVELL